MKFKHGLLNLLIMLTLSACSAATAVPASNTSVVNPVTNSTNADDAVESTAAPSAAASQVENGDTHDDISDYEWDAAAVIPITLDGSAISATSDTVSVAGSIARITAAGTYSLSGTLTDGQIVVNSEGEGIVRLIFNGVQLNNTTTAPVFIEDADEVMLVMADGSRNSITDGSNYTFSDPAVEEPNAAIFSNADLTITGTGTLTVTGNFNDAISSDDGIIISSGTLNVFAVDDGIRGKDYIVVKDGVLTVQSKGDGLKSDKEEDLEKGYIAIQNGTIVVNAGGDALAAETDVMISAGSFDLTSGGGAGGSFTNDSAKAIKGLVSVNIDGGSFSLNAADDAIHSNGSISVNAGNFTIASGDDGVHADAAITFNGGEVLISQSYEGIESAVITINGGAFDITSSDDGVNVANGMDSSGMGGPRGGQDTFAQTGSNILYVNGGRIVVNSGGDGLDINGTIQMIGGEIIVSGPVSQGNAALDYDGGFSMTGGLVVAAGSSGMAQAPGGTGQNALMVFFETTQAAGTPVHIADSAGNAILTYVPGKDYQSLAFSSPELITGKSYTISLGGSPSGDSVGGLYTPGSYSGGSEYASFTVSSGVTQLGTGGGFGGPRRRGP